MARCRQAPPGSCRVLRARLRASPGRATQHRPRPRPQEHRPGGASQCRNDLRRRPHHRCPLPSHSSSSLSLPSKHRRNAIRSAPNRRCRCADVADRHNASRGHVQRVQHPQQGSRAVSLRKTGWKRTRPKPDIRDIIGRWGEGCARRLRDGWFGAARAPSPDVRYGILPALVSNAGSRDMGSPSRMTPTLETLAPLSPTSDNVSYVRFRPHSFPACFPQQNRPAPLLHAIAAGCVAAPSAHRPGSGDWAPTG